MGRTIVSGSLKALPVQGICHCEPDQSQAWQSPNFGERHCKKTFQVA
ncbi:MAG: hypothetical protein IJV35_01275 [Neisseriaceae bacterium]|nr:hypothetical protein [Neisseriaceae bacterium]